jgi:hypothetical protein
MLRSSPPLSPQPVDEEQQPLRDTASLSPSSHSSSQESDDSNDLANLSSLWSYGSADDVPSTPEPATPDAAATNTNNVTFDDDDDEAAIALLTRRLRCLFSVITWPIVPFGTLACVGLLWLLYASWIPDFSRSCSHPLHGYAWASLALILYAPYHAALRHRLFPLSDGPAQSTQVRRFDQTFHTLALLYVYAGITLLQTCREDVPGLSLDVVNSNSTAPSSINTCADTCPHLYEALEVYIAALELFTFSLILPLLCLPCLYLWFLRQAQADTEALARLQERLRDEEYMMHHTGGVSAREIMEQLKEVQLLWNDQEQKVLVLPKDSDDWSLAKDASQMKECCICMENFAMHNDVEAASEEEIVRTVPCGHIFHKHCMAGWVEGRWQGNGGETPALQPPVDSHRRARRTTCPLCRADLRRRR